MAKFIFSLGVLDKKIVLPFLLSLNQVLLNIIDYYYEKNEIIKSNVLDSLAISLGEMTLPIIPCLLKYKYKVVSKKNICNKKNIKYQAILAIADILLIALIAGSSLITDGSELSNPHLSIMCTKEAIEMVVLAIISIIFLKYKYYIHHYISMIIFCIFSAGIDILLDNFKEGLFNQSFVKIILEVLALIAEMANYCYQMYMMRNLVYHYWSVGFSLGCILLVINLFTLFGSLFMGDPNGDKDAFLNGVYYYFNNVGIGYIILRFLLQFIFFGFIMTLLKMLTLNNFEINYILISYGISKFSNILLKSKNENKWYSLILFLGQFISLMFFLEIFEYNFCKLNKNTKKNVQLREATDMIMRESINSTDIEGYLIKDIPEKNNIETPDTMREMENIEKILFT